MRPIGTDGMVNSEDFDKMPRSVSALFAKISVQILLILWQIAAIGQGESCVTSISFKMDNLRHNHVTVPGMSECEL